MTESYGEGKVMAGYDDLLNLGKVSVFSGAVLSTHKLPCALCRLLLLLEHICGEQGKDIQSLGRTA